MKLLKRDLSTFKYCVYEGEVEYVDGNGNYTGETIVSYGEAIETKGRIFDGGGKMNHELFGSDLSADKVLVLDNLNTSINEYSVFFIDKEVEYDSSNNPLYNYIVADGGIKHTPNLIYIALEKVRNVEN